MKDRSVKQFIAAARISRSVSMVEDLSTWLE
jgi:hypothetical protein